MKGGCDSFLVIVSTVTCQSLGAVGLEGVDCFYAVSNLDGGFAIHDEDFGFGDLAPSVL
jgi:predicted TIM-barrel enzyme